MSRSANCGPPQPWHAPRSCTRIARATALLGLLFSRLPLSIVRCHFVSHRFPRSPVPDTRYRARQRFMLLGEHHPAYLEALTPDITHLLAGELGARVGLT